MADESEGSDAGAAASGAGVDPFAAAMGLSGASREDAHEFLSNQNALVADQRKLVQLQAKELSHELKLRHWSLQLRHASAILKFALEVSLALIAIAVACFIGVVVWDAAHADGLIVESFSVPPDLAARGLTGQVMATKLLDRILAMDAHNNSQRAPKSYANSWSQEDLKIEIPQTGLSVGELDNFLRQKLGHETHVTGEIVRTQTGLDLTARAGANEAGSVTGSETQLDALIQSLAESVYHQTQPYRYGVYLQTHDRLAEAVTVFKALAETGPVSERPWGYNGWSNAISDSESLHFRNDLLKRALALEPDVQIVRNNLAINEGYMGQTEQALADTQKALALLSRPDHGQLRDDSIPGTRKAEQGYIAGFLGAWADDAQDRMEGNESGINTTTGSRSVLLTLAQSRAHDLAGARATEADPEASAIGGASGLNELRDIQVRIEIGKEAQDWSGVLTQDQAVVSVLAKSPSLKSFAIAMTDPLVAYAQGKLGDFKAAEARIAPTPADCYPCLIVRAQIADMEGKRADADAWFQRAVDAGPSLPTANAAWGQVLLDRGQPDAAIEKFTLANQKGPHFADPLEGWGEALMAKNQSHLALAKFEEAEKYAPNWGRLHLKWGEALFFAGKKDEAQKQFVKAVALDLTSDEKSELARHP